MRKGRDLILSALLIGIVVFFASTKSYAACDPLLGTKCGDFGKNTITLIQTLPAQCPDLTQACTEYQYTYTGTPTTIEVLIPKLVQTKFPTSTGTGCSVFITDGSGDPINGFGVNIFSHNLCKVPLAAGAFSIFADLSTAKPLSWQEIVNKSITADTLNGPAVPGSAVEETGATLTTTDGKIVSYTNIGGQIAITNSNTPATTLPLNKTKLCVPTTTGKPITFTNTQGNWTCETITFATEQCDIKTAGTDPCRFIGGSCISY